MLSIPCFHPTILTLNSDQHLTLQDVNQSGSPRDFVCDNETAAIGLDRSPARLYRQCASIQVGTPSNHKPPSLQAVTISGNKE